ncbi:prepilin-type N-terminal cleavage/methylation domain-containing protein [Pseudomonas sp. LJDD11]|uniref:prepilin-type N-terminal cleavage/methylation domain-containing protein n=1 Tax=unclassified Pseudomonas TaxID=196821 RepID=UPI0004F78DD6|nr:MULTISPECIES: prepilin-type N-terminal cleavage/methylation domain-containing protein [unclassified Pseudomonas]MCQ9425862.1 prepilin-type N-terminal cleavage/methylation domain-containing protein [Pseudomonas sp. LJDD11]BAP43191.1 type II secretion system protein J [Pseudomonas sp. StFLB209]
MKHARGLTLIELLVALALTAVLGVVLAALVNGWSKVRERLGEASEQPQVLEFCLALERRFDSLIVRQLYEQRLPLPLYALDWQPAANQLDWVALSAWPEAGAASRQERQRLLYEQRERRLSVATSQDLYAVAAPRWQRREQLEGVDRVQWSFYQGNRWLAFPSSVAASPTRGVRLAFDYQGSPYVCTFNLADLTP